MNYRRYYIIEHYVNENIELLMHYKMYYTNLKLINV